MIDSVFGFPCACRIRGLVSIVKVDFTLTANIHLIAGLVTVATVKVGAQNVALGSLLGRPGFPAAALAIEVKSVLGSCVVPLTPACIIQGLLGTLTSAVTQGVGPLVGGVVEGALLGRAARWRPWAGSCTAPPAAWSPPSVRHSGVYLGAAGPSSSITLELGRGSVGVNWTVGGTADLAGRCAGY